VDRADQVPVNSGRSFPDQVHGSPDFSALTPDFSAQIDKIMVRQKMVFQRGC
jgi:hypothetical protein